MKTYISYLKDVLGIREFMHSQSAVTEELPLVKSDKKWRVLFLTDREWTVPERTLFLKITQAMKLKENDFVVHEVSVDAITEILDDVGEAQSLVCFSFELKSAMETLGYEVYFSPDPQAMLKNPGLKKEAWEVLKKL